LFRTKLEFVLRSNDKNNSKSYYYYYYYTISKVCDTILKRHQTNSSVAMNKGFHDVGLRKQHLGYHKSWECLYFTFPVWFCVLHCVDVGCAYWR